MGCPTPTCPECTRNCLLIHGKNKDPSPFVASFFKVMITDKFSEVLFLPPKIARTMRDLVDKEVHLEDARGKRWTVTLSWCDGSLAFQQGWNSFSLQHTLEVGDFMVFHYVLGSHFVVQIFGKNGCERTHFSGKIGRPRKRNKPAGAEDVKYHSVDTNSMDKQGQGTSAVSGSNMEIVTDNELNIENGSPKKMLNEELLCMIGMDARRRNEDHMNSLYDLLDLEMQRPSHVDVTTGVLEHESSLCHDNRLPTPQAGGDTVDKIPVTEKLVSMDVPNLEIPVTEKLVSMDVPNLEIPETEKLVSMDVPNLEIPEANEDCQMTEKIALVSINDSGNGDTIEQEQMKKTKSTGEKRKGTCTKQFGTKMKACGITEMVNGNYTESKERVQSFNHPVEDKEDKEDKDRVFKVIKTEPVDTFELASADSVIISFTVTETKPFVELPGKLPCFSSKGRPRPISERKSVVLLRDPGSRLWPVLYQEKSGMKALTSGWEAFAKANSIRPGDECAFEVENKFESIYKVGIVPK